MLDPIDAMLGDFGVDTTPPSGSGTSLLDAIGAAFETELGGGAAPTPTPGEDGGGKPAPGEDGGDKPAEGDDDSVFPDWAKDVKVNEAFQKSRSEAKEWKTKAREAQEALEAAKAELEKFQGRPDPEEYQKLKSQLDENESYLAAAKVEASATYRNEVIKPLGGVVEAAKKVGGEALVEALFEDNAEKRNDMLVEIFANKNPVDSRRIDRLVEEADAIFEKRKGLLDQAPQSWEKLQAQEKAQQETAERDARGVYEAEVAKVLGVVEKKAGTLLDFLGDQKEATLDRVKGTNLAKAEPVVQAFAALSSELLPVALKENRALQAQIAELKQTLTDIGGATPGAGTGGSKQETGRKPVSEGGFLESIEAGLRE